MTNPSARPVRTAHKMCCWLWTLCHTTQHGAVLIISPLNLQTITITQMLSSGRGGVIKSLIILFVECIWYWCSADHMATQTIGHSSIDISVICDTQRPWSFVQDLRRDEICGWWWWWTSVSYKHTFCTSGTACCTPLPGRLSEEPSTPTLMAEKPLAGRHYICLLLTPLMAHWHTSNSRVEAGASY